jgi:hypothetical protein
MQNGLDATFFYDVKNEYGDQAEKIVRPHMEMEPRYPHTCTLAAGDSLTGEAQISREYKFDRAGTYTIQVSRYASDDPNDETKVYSNTITITITG